MSTPDDVAVLVERARAGDQSAWNDLVTRFTSLLWSVARAHRLDSAMSEDVVQTTWLRLMENLPSIRQPERLAGWLATTARRECLKIIRQSGRESVGWDDDTLTALPDTYLPALDHELLLAERDAALWECFNQLSSRCKWLLRVLISVDSSSYAEVSEAMGLPIGSIGPTRMRCLQRLRDLSQEAGYPFTTSTEGTTR